MKRLALVLLFLALSLDALGGPWGREKGEFFLAPQAYYYTADKYWNRHGSKKEIGCTFKKWEYATYGEYGLDDETTITFRIPYIRIECGGSSESGLGDIEAGVIRRLRSWDSSVLSFQLLSVIPTGYSIDKDLRLGYGRFGIEPSLLFGFGQESYFLEGGVGYRYYFGYPSDQIRGYGRAGLKGNGWMLIDTLDVQWGLNNGDTKRVGRNITVEPYYRLVQNDIDLVVNLFDGLSLSVGFVKALWGRNTGDGKNFYAQLWFRF